VRVGMEATGYSRWFERLLGELGHEVWIGDAAKIRASCERKQKTDRRDAVVSRRMRRLSSPSLSDRLKISDFTQKCGLIEKDRSQAS
jgi:transposase